MSALIGALRVSLGLDSAAFERGVGKSKKELNEFNTTAGKAGFAVGRFAKLAVAAGGAIAASALVTTVKDLIVKGLEHASALGEQAQQLGVTTKALQEYRYAATQAGLSQEEMDKSLAMLTKRMGDAAAGAKEPAGAFKALGIDIKAFIASGKDAGDLIPLIAEGLKKYSTDAEKAAIVTDLFGRSGQKLMPLLSDGAKGVNDLRMAAHELGIVMDDAMITKADEAADKLAALQQVLNAKLAVAVASNADKIIELVDGIEQLAIKAERAWKALSKLADNPLVKVLGQAGSRLNPLNMNMRALEFSAGVLAREEPKKTTGGAAPQTNFMLRNSPIRARPTMPLLAPQMLRQRLAETADAFAPGAGVRGGLEAISKAATEATAALTKFVAVNDNVAPLMDRLFPEQAEYRQYQEDMKAIEEAEKRGAVSADLAAEARRRLFSEIYPSNMQEIIQSWADLNLAMAPEEIERGIERLTGSVSGVVNQTGIAKVQVAENMKQMADATLSAIDRMVGAIKGGGFLNILSSVIGLGLQLGGIGAFGKKIQTNINSVPAYANGTNYAAGGLSLVGERGPELVGLPRGSKVWPNGSGPGSRVEVVPSRYFDVIVDGRIMRAAPAIADAGGKVGMARVAQSGTWKLR